MKTLKIFWIFLGLKWDETIGAIVWYDALKWGCQVIGLSTGVAAVIVGPSVLLAWLTPLYFAEAILFLVYIEGLFGTIVSVCTIKFKRWIQNNWKQAKSIYGNSHGVW